MDKAFFKLLLKQHGIAFGGILTVSLLILTSGLLQLHFQVLSVLCVLWQFMIMLIGFCASLVSIFLWGVIRYLQASTISNLKKTCWTLLPLSIIVIGSTLLGMCQISNNNAFEGTILVFSTLIGCVIFKEAVGRSRFSEPDHYMTVSFTLFTCQIEGKAFSQWSKVIDVAVIPLFLLFPILLIYGCLWWLLHDTLGNLSVRWAILSLIIIGCTILVLLYFFEKGKYRIVRRPKIHQLFHCLKLLSKPQSINTPNKIARVAKSYGLKNTESFKHLLDLITGDVCELYHFSKATCPDLGKQAIEWMLQCQQSRGFGLWPQSGPRLISTYHALSILEDSDRLDSINPSGHISWIQSCQQPDGSFKSPWSKRNTWEDTFFAVTSLNILGTSLETGQTDRCRQLCRNFLQEGLTKDRAEMVYYSIGSLEALDHLDEKTIKTASQWIVEKTEKLLLANIGLNYENIHFVVMTYDILNQISPLTSMNPQIKLLTDRIQTALDAELADLRQ